MNSNNDRPGQEAVAVDADTRSLEQPNDYVHAAGALEPFRLAVVAWGSVGWVGVLPLPRGQKVPPPGGFTGRAGRDPSLEQTREWVQRRSSGNAALRLPRDVIGLDVDDYDAKPGRATLQAYTAQFGQLPPTFKVTSRGLGLSGIYLFRVPEGSILVSELEGGGIEVVQHHHRYVVLPGSVHPEGRAYELFGPDGAPAARPPAPCELPELPAAWLECLLRTTTATRAPRSPRTKPGPPPSRRQVPEGASAPGEGSDDGSDVARSPAPSCRAAQGLYDAALKAVTQGERHAAMLKALLPLLQAHSAGHHGVPELADALREEYVGRVQDVRGSSGLAGREFDSMVEGPRTPRLTDHDRYQICSCDTDDWLLWLGRPDAFTGRGARVQRRVMQSLIRDAQRTGSARVRKSTRQIAEDAESTPPTVAKHLRLLRAQGWFSEVLSRGRQTTELILAPTRVIATTEGHADQACTAVVRGTSAPTHPLFGSQGLRGNQELTFNVLDLYRKPAGRVVLLAVRPGQDIRSAKLRRPGWRQLTRASNRGGLTPKAISTLTGLPVETVRKHLNQMREVGLVVKIYDLWFRLFFLPDEVAEEWGVDAVPARRKERFLEQRRLYWDGRASLPPDDRRCVIKDVQEGVVSYVHPLTGEVKWSIGSADKPVKLVITSSADSKGTDAGGGSAVPTSY